MSASHLFDLAAMFAEAHGKAERFTALADARPEARRAGYEADAENWRTAAARLREELRTAIGEARPANTPAARHNEAPVPTRDRATSPTDRPWPVGRNRSMDLGDTARVRQPSHPVEYRLGTVTDVDYAPFTTYVRRYQLRFPSGEERSYAPVEVVARTRADDRAALIAGFTDACLTLRDACRIAHDHDPELSDEVHLLLASLVGTAHNRLGVPLDPATLPEPTTDHGARP